MERISQAKAILPNLNSADKSALIHNLIKWEQYNATKHYQVFFRSAWSVIEPSTPLAWNWHIQYLCDELQQQAIRISLRQPRQYHLIINVPPRSLKSSLVSKIYQPWCWSKWPSFKFFTASYSDDLAVEAAVHSRRIIQSPWYQGYWGNVFKLSGDQNLKTFFENDKYGYRIATSIGGTGTGRGGNIIVIDDPLNAKEADSEAKRKEVLDWWTGTMQTRLNNQAVDLFIIVMQRLHENDLTGHIMTYQGRKFKHICIPAE